MGIRGGLARVDHHRAFAGEDETDVGILRLGGVYVDAVLDLSHVGTEVLGLRRQREDKQQGTDESGQAGSHDSSVSIKDADRLTRFAPRFRSLRPGAGDALPRAAGSERTR